MRAEACRLDEARAEKCKLKLRAWLARLPKNHFRRALPILPQRQSRRGLSVALWEQDGATALADPLRREEWGIETVALELFYKLADDWVRGELIEVLRAEEESLSLPT